ncbi:MAG: phosphatase PAP2 family protein [Actinobacteria bacterium]|nr:phosphatase PAP2 family protein [Actinomycetota bacterium]
MTGEQATAAADRWRLIRRRAARAYLILLVLLVILVGVPTDRGSLLLIILAGLGVTCLGRGWRAFGRVLLDWLPFTFVLVVYDVSRGIARIIGLPLHERDIADADKAMFDGTVPTVWLQNRLLDPGSPHWYDALATLIYTTHFLATPIVAALLWLRNRAIWISFIVRVVALSVAGLITYVLFPAAPPWYAARDGVIPPAIRASARGWTWLHLNHAGNLLSEGQLAANAVAAMPSLHTAFATLIALFVVRHLSSRWRWIALGYPPLMGLALVYLGEHYVVDVLAGVAYAVATDLGVSAWERRHRAKRPISTDVATK